MKFKKNDKVVIVNVDNNIWENKKGIILGDADKKEITDETEDYLVKVFFTDDKTITQIFNEDNLELEGENVLEPLTESKKPDKKDFIYNYVYLEDMEDTDIPSWFFVDKLAAAENMEAEDVVEESIALGYKLFEVMQGHFKKLIVAAPKCKVETISEECADYVLGSIVVIELIAKENK